MLGLALFIYLLVSRRVDTSNRCFFVHNMAYMAFVNMLQVFYTCFFHNSPFVYSRHKYSSDVLNISIVRWSTAALIMLISHFSFYIAAFAKIISLTFKRRYQHEVWNEKVAVVAFLISLGFPLLFVGSYMLEHPRSLVLYKTSFCDKSSTSTLIDYNNLRLLICSLGLITVIFGLFMALIKKLYSAEVISLFRRINPPIVRTMTSPSDNTPAYRPFRVRLRSMDVHYGFILIFYGFLMLFETFYLENGFPYYSPYELIIFLVRATFLPFITLLYYTVPLLVELIHYLAFHQNRKESVVRGGDLLVLSPFHFITRTDRNNQTCDEYVSVHISTNC
ncbi:unnamed protein product [Auanema sp. JU1783]|nr:unnamed protein product [Auanema sp. JU1783]